MCAAWIDSNSEVPRAREASPQSGAGRRELSDMVDRAIHQKNIDQKNDDRQWRCFNLSILVIGGEWNRTP